MRHLRADLFNGKSDGGRHLFQFRIGDAEWRHEHESVENGAREKTVPTSGETNF